MLAVTKTGMLCVWLFTSNLGLCIYELNLFFWLSMTYHLIVYGAELNQQTPRQSTSELQDKTAQLQTRCVFHLSVWPERRVEDDEEEGRIEGREEQICLLIVLEEADAQAGKS